MLVIKENNAINITITFAGRRKLKILLSEYLNHKIPAEIHPSEIRLKYNALNAEISGYDDQNEVNKNQVPGIRNNNIGVILLSAENRESVILSGSEESPS